MNCGQSAAWSKKASPQRYKVHKEQKNIGYRTGNDEYRSKTIALIIRNSLFDIRYFSFEDAD
jgi:hypothetical protein